MAYIIKARFYANNDQLGESYIITSDNSEKDTKLEVGRKVEISYPKGYCEDTSCVDNIDNICKFKGDCGS